MAVVVDVDRLVPAGVVGGQVVLVQDPAVRAAGFPDAACNLALVERGASLLGDPPQRDSQVALYQELARVQRAPARREHRLRRSIRSQRLLLGRQGRGQLVAHREAALAQLDRGSEHLGQVQLAEPALCQQPAVDQARHRHAQHAVHWNTAMRQVPLARRPCRCRPGAVDAVRAPGGGVEDQDEAVAAHARHRRLHHAHRRGHGNRGVDCIAALLHDAHAGLRGERMTGCHHAIEARHRRPVGRMADAVRRRGTHLVSPGCVDA